jgi:hypothetical protein
MKNKNLITLLFIFLLSGCNDRNESSKVEYNYSTDKIKVVEAKNVDEIFNSMPSEQQEFNSFVFNIPFITYERNTREEDEQATRVQQYVESKKYKLSKFSTGKYFIGGDGAGFGTNSSDQVPLNEVVEWICISDDAYQPENSHKSVYECKFNSDNFKKQGELHWDPDEKIKMNEKFYKGDLLKVSGKVKFISIEQWGEKWQYDIQLSSVSISVVKK